VGSIGTGAPAAAHHVELLAASQIWAAWRSAAFNGAVRCEGNLEV